MRERGHLHHPTSAVIIGCVALGDAVGVRHHPGGVIGEPFFDRVQVGL
jgi:hypothetical protein